MENIQQTNHHGESVLLTSLSWEELGRLIQRQTLDEVTKPFVAQGVAENQADGNGNSAGKLMGWMV